VFHVSGAGYAPHGKLSLDGRAVDPGRHPALGLAIRAAVLCNDARLCEEAGSWRVEGDPTEGALLALGAKTGLTRQLAHSSWPRLDCIPFESQHRLMATHHR